MSITSKIDVNGLRSERYGSETDYSKIAARLNSAADIIMDNIHWMETTKGQDFWSNVHTELRRLHQNALDFHKLQATPNLTISGDVADVSQVLINGVTFVKKA